MTLHTQALLQIRKKTARKYFIWGWVTGIWCVLSIFLYVRMAEQSIVRSLLSGICGLLLILLLDIFQHRQNILYLLDPQFQNAAGQFETYQTRRFQRWEDRNMLRVIIGALLLVALLFFLFFVNESKWVYIMATLFICFLLYSMLKSWMHFQDQITLHDIRRISRDQAPDIST